MVVHMDVTVYEKNIIIVIVSRYDLIRYRKNRNKYIQTITFY